jgi:3-methyl-2-oxobutanoate hydroxymethyltransferase
MAKVTLSTLRRLKEEHKKFGTITAYDAAFAHLFDECGVPALLVGDSLGMVMQGRESTIGVTVDDVVYHTGCVSRAVTEAMVIADMPFMSYDTPESACRNAARLMQAGASVVKIEGGVWLVPVIERLLQNGVPVCAHIGLTPQFVNIFGGYKIQGREEAQAQKIVETALKLQNAGASLLVVECVPAPLGSEIAARLDIPVIGIGAGNQTDGQILVMHDAFGITPGHTPKFARNFLKETGDLRKAVELYLSEVENGSFPNENQSFF